MSNNTKDKAFKIGGIALVLWFLLRKAGTSAPIPGDTYGAPFSIGGGNFKGMPVKWVYFNKDYPLQVTLKPDARENDIFTVKDNSTGQNFVPAQNETIGTVIRAYQDTGDKNLIWFQVKPTFRVKYKSQLTNFWVATFNDGKTKEFFKVG